MKWKLLTNGIVTTIAICTIPCALAQTGPIPTNLPNVRAYRQPPAGFNPLTASPEALQLCGYPPRPDPREESAAFSAWAKAVSTPQTRIFPTLEQTNHYHLPAQNVQPRVNSQAMTEISAQVISSGNAQLINGNTSKNWSGYCLSDPKTKPFAHSFVWSFFIIPEGQAAFNGTYTDPLVHCSQWVGIDGLVSKDLLQAGTEADAFSFDPAIAKAPFYFAWFEWFPNSATKITNLLVTGGDVMFVEVWNTSPTQAQAFLVDCSTNHSVSLAFSAPSGTTLVGDSMEWIVERPQINGVNATLTNYIACPFEYAEGGNYSMKTMSPGMTQFSGTIHNLSMLDDAGGVISVCHLI